MEKGEQKGLEDEETSRPRCRGAGTPFGMGHESNDVSFRIGDARDVVRRSVRIFQVAEHDLSPSLQFLQVLVGKVETAFLVRDGKGKPVPFGEKGREGGTIVLHDQGGLFTDEAPRRVNQEHAGKNPGFDKDLESIADTEHGLSVPRETPDGIDDRSLCGDRSRPEVIPVGESPRKDDGVDPCKVGLCMADPHRFKSRDVPYCLECVEIAIRAGEAEDPDVEPCGDLERRRELSRHRFILFGTRSFSQTERASFG
jgi:hypothetical protein